MPQFRYWTQRSRLFWPHRNTSEGSRSLISAYSDHGSKAPAALGRDKPTRVRLHTKPPCHRANETIALVIDKQAIFGCRHTRRWQWNTLIQPQQGRFVKATFQQFFMI